MTTKSESLCCKEQAGWVKKQRPNWLMTIYLLLRAWKLGWELGAEETDCQLSWWGKCLQLRRGWSKRNTKKQRQGSQQPGWSKFTVVYKTHIWWMRVLYLEPKNVGLLDLCIVTHKSKSLESASLICMFTLNFHWKSALEHALMRAVWT